MSGIVFFRTEQREQVVDWYLDHFDDVEVWLEQTGCTILRCDGFRFGFCDGDETETEGILTFVYDTSEQVDEMHHQLSDAARENPNENELYRIYQFFARDPDGRTVEVQSFLHDTPPV